MYTPLNQITMEKYIMDIHLVNFPLFNCWHWQEGTNNHHFVGKTRRVVLQDSDDDNCKELQEIN